MSASVDDIELLPIPADSALSLRRRERRNGFDQRLLLAQ